VYVQYRNAGYSKAFKGNHEADILLHQAAKKHFDSLGMKKLPTVASLRAEYAVQLEEKKKAYREYQRPGRKCANCLWGKQIPTVY